MSNEPGVSRWGWVTIPLLGVAAVTGWWPTLRGWWPGATSSPSALSAEHSPGQAGHESDHNHAHAGDDHDHAGHEHDHSAGNSIELSEQARKNLGLQTGEVTESTFVRTIPVPGIVAERPGQTRVRVVAPLTGIVTRVHVIEGEAVPPGEPLFELRLTHEDLLESQVEFLRLTEELDVVNRELERLRPIVDKGALPQKTLLDRQYEQQKLRGAQRAQRQSLRLHGLSDSQIDEVEQSRTLLSLLTIVAPFPPPETIPPVLSTQSREAPGNAVAPSSADTSHDSNTDRAHSAPPLLQIENLQTEVGRLVTAGDPLLSLADYSWLYLEGNAFEQDADWIAQAVSRHAPITAVIENQTPPGPQVTGLSILYLSDQIDPVERTLHFYLALPNQTIRDESVSGHRFLNWRFKPGQRTQLLIPVEEWPDRLVVPTTAVVQEGLDWFVFQENGDHFDRRPVHVEYRDRTHVVIAPDGSLFPGDVIALTGAAQLQMALRNRSGGAIDPHAGHTH
jgi:cobalt-zinc-cadmium efflux system membrane fusion protein